MPRPRTTGRSQSTARRTTIITRGSAWPGRTSARWSTTGTASRWPNAACVKRSDRYHRQIAIYRKAYHDHHSWIGVAWANLGTMEYHRNRFEVAERCLREALRSVPPADRNLPQGVPRSSLVDRRGLGEPRHDGVPPEPLRGGRTLPA